MNQLPQNTVVRNFTLASTKVFIILLAALIFGFLMMLPVQRVDSHLVGSDGPYYYSYMRSAIMDRDFNIDNDLELYNSRMSEDNPYRRTVSYYVWPVGTSVLWAPFFIIGHVAVLLLNRMGFNISTDGYSYIEESFISIGSIFYAVVGLYLMYKTLLRLFSDRTSLVTAVSVFLGSPVFYYALFEPSMSHSVEFFSVSLLFWLLLNNSSKSVLYWLFIGIAAGVVTIVRWQNILFLLFCLFILLRDGISENSKIYLAGIAKKVLAGFCGFLPVVFLQAFFWKVTLGEYLLVPQGEGFLSYMQPHLTEVLLSTRNGLFVWSPIAIGIFGLYLLRQKGLAVVLAGIFLLDVYVCSIVLDWWGGAGFGQRRLVGALPIMALGLAAVVERVNREPIRRFLKIFLILSVIWNFAFIVQYRLGFIPMGSYLSFDQLITDKLLLPLQIWKWFSS